LFVRAAKETNLQARQHFEKALELDPQYTQAYVRLGLTYWLEFSQQWNLDPQLVERAFELVQKAVALDDALPQAYSALALIYLGKRQPERSLAEAERAVTLDPSFADGYTNLANVLNTMGKPKEALKAAEKALRLNPYGPFFYFVNLGVAYHLIGQDADTITAMKETIKRNPNFVPAYTFLADGYVKLWLWQLSHDQQILEHALGTAQQAVALNASAPFTHFTLGMVQLTRQHYDQAIAEMEQVIALAPNDATGYAGLAWLLSVVGKKEEALRSSEQAQRLGPPALLSAYDLSLGFAYYFLGHYEQAIPHLKKWLILYPAHCLAHTTLAAIYSELGREAEARAEVAAVLRINPNFSLEVNKQREPIKDPAISERHIAALRKAGLK
jgi:tetratricopeptide (TPR) repeat protein